VSRSVLFGILALALATTTAACASNAPNAGAKTSYAGKTVTIVAASATGGGTDQLSRLLAQFLPRHLPGNPTTIVQNVPGGNGVDAGNQIYTKTKPDGLTLLASSGGGGIVGFQRLNTPGVLYDINKMPIFLGTVAGSVCFVSSETGIRQPQDIRSPKVPIFRGGGDRNNTSSIEADIPMTELFQVPNYKAIYSYGSLGPARLAFIRGETNMHCDDTLAYSDSSVQDMIKTGKAVPVFQTGLLQADGKIIRHPAASEVPTVLELYQQLFGKDPSGIAWQAYLDDLQGRAFGKIVAGPPGLPADNVGVIEQALRDLVKDQEWIDQTKSVTGEAIIPPFVTIGADVQPLIKDFMSASPEVKQWLTDWSKKGS